jgi:YVTN family beta-propeller protein
VIDTTTYKLIDTNTKLKGPQYISVGSSPSALALGPDGKLSVANRGSNTVSVIDTTTKNYSVVKTISGFSQPSSVAVNTVGSRVYVVNSGNATVSVIDTTNGYTLVDTNPNFSGIQSISVGPSSSSVKLSRDGTLAFVANGNDTVSPLPPPRSVPAAAARTG